MTVIAHHLVWTNYGTWLPNDLRGSGSQSVYTPALAELGESQFGRRRVQPPRQAIREFYRDAVPRLQFPIIQFTPRLIDEIADAFAGTISAQQYTCYACSIMPNHVHLVMRKHKHSAELMIENLQTESRDRLRSLCEIGANHPVWTKSGRRIFLDSPSSVRTRIRYVENNPGKEGLPSQSWPFVVEYDNWPFHKKLNRKR